MTRPCHVNTPLCPRFAALGRAARVRACRGARTSPEHGVGCTQHRVAHAGVAHEAQREGRQSTRALRTVCVEGPQRPPLPAPLLCGSGRGSCKHVACMHATCMHDPRHKPLLNKLATLRRDLSPRGLYVFLNFLRDLNLRGLYFFAVRQDALWPRKNTSTSRL